MSFLITQPGEGSQNYKTAVRAASSSDTVLSGVHPLLFGGVTLANNDRVLLKDQALPEQNGIYTYTVSGINYYLTRSTDANTSREVVPNMLVPVAEGTYADQLFQLLTNGPITLGTTALNFGFAVLYDHGLLPGLGDDDHTQYHNDTRALTWLGTRSTADLPENVNYLYFTDLRAQNAVVTQTITNGVTNKSPSEDAVFDALALKVTGPASATPTSIPVYADGTGKLLNGASGWRITGSALIPFADGVGDIGGSAIARPGEVWVKNRINLASLTASRVMVSDASKNLSSSSVTDVELGYLSGVTSAIQSQLNSKVSSVTGSAPITSSGGTTPTISISQASALTDGYLSSTDWTTFNSKQPAGNYANDQLSNLNATTAINSSLLFGVDNSLNIGADGANRPASIHAANYITAPVIQGRDNVNSAQHSITVRAGNGVTGNKDGGNLTLAGGTKSGSGTNGEIIVQVAGSEIARFEKESVLKLSGGLKIKSLHNQIGTLDIITVGLSDYYIGVDSSGINNKRIDLPLAATAGVGKIYVIKDESGNATANSISVFPNGTNKIDGINASYVLNVDYESIMLVCNGTDGWFII